MSLNRTICKSDDAALLELMQTGITWGGAGIKVQIPGPTPKCSDSLDQEWYESDATGL